MRYSAYRHDRDPSSFSRRALLGGMAGAAALGAVWPLGSLAAAAPRKGRIKQSACFICYKAYLAKHHISFDQFAAAWRGWGSVRSNRPIPTCGRR